MAVQMHPEDFLMDHKSGFMIGIATCYLSMALLHINYLQHIPRCRQYATRRIKTYGIALTILFVAILVAYTAGDETWADWFCVFGVITACTCTVAVALISFRVDPRYQNWTIEYFEERFGLLVMI
eukprot:UN23704